MFFFFNDTATTEIYTLSLHDALPICSGPKGQLDPLFVFLADVGAKRDVQLFLDLRVAFPDRTSTRLNSSHRQISYDAFLSFDYNEPPGTADSPAICRSARASPSVIGL